MLHLQIPYISAFRDTCPCSVSVSVGPAPILGFASDSKPYGGSYSAAAVRRPACLSSFQADMGGCMYCLHLVSVWRTNCRHYIVQLCLLHSNR